MTSALARGDAKTKSPVAGFRKFSRLTATGEMSAAVKQPAGRGVTLQKLRAWLKAFAIAAAERSEPRNRKANGVTERLRAVGTKPVMAFVYWYPPKKKNRSLTIGPPRVKPPSLRRALGRSIPSLLKKKSLAFS